MELQLYQKIFDHIKSPVVISYSESLIECNRAFLDLLKVNSIHEVQQYSSLRKVVDEILFKGVNTQYKSIQDLQGHTQLFEVSLSTLSETESIYLIEFKVVDDQSLYEEITFVSAHNRELFNNSPDAIVILDNSGKVVDMNEAFEELFGYTRLETIGQDIDTLVVPENQKKQAKELYHRVLSQERVEVTIQRQTKDHRMLDVHVVAYPVIIDKRLTGNYVIYQDITQMKKTEKLLHEKEEFLEQLFNRSLFPTAILDDHEIILDINAKFEELFGYTRDESIGKHINTLVVPEGYENEANKFKIVILDNRTMIAKTKRKHKNGSLLDVEAVGSPVLIGGKVQGFFAMYRDIRVEEEALQNLKALLNTDQLTGLYSRKFIYDTIEHQLSKEYNNQEIRGEWAHALIYVDLDEFKDVNDTYGHETGDHLLIDVAKHLQQAFGSKAIVSRIGGDEFLIFMDNIDREKVKKKIHILRTNLAKPCNINGHILSTVASIGSSFYPEDGITTDELISAADTQMYDEKKKRRIQRIPVRVDPTVYIDPNN